MGNYCLKSTEMDFKLDFIFCKIFLFFNKKISSKKSVSEENFFDYRGGQKFKKYFIALFHVPGHSDHF